MRTIKFRGKRIDNKEWAYGHLFYGEDQTEDEMAYIVSEDYCCFDDTIELNTCASWEVDLETVGQYTGLKDKNGIEIYEGDIVLYEDWETATESGSGDMFINKGIVEYNESNCCFNITERQTIDNLDILFEYTDCIEVIGNIYENKELLEEQ